jgi:uncharacterized protein (DUF2141 family)
VGLTVSSAAARVYAHVMADVAISATAIDGNTLTITGENFGGGTPTVSVGDSAAVVARHTDTEIVVQTPALAPGMYSVKVVRDANAGGTAVSSLFIR